MRKILAVVAIFYASITFSQNTKPKLVVGIVVDQMRYDYLDRFWSKFGDNGFKKLINGGFNCKNNHFNYMPTYTAPGHASIYTGTTPENHGIIANTWYDKSTGNYTYCTSDTTYFSLGTDSYAGRMSPLKLQATTITDELKLNTNFKGKVIGLSLKDRGAILPAGHKADGAYWYEGGDVGKWVSSTYYGEGLPKWVDDINEKNTANDYLSKPWETLLPMTEYSESIDDNNHYEGAFTNEVTPTFPHDLPALRDSNSNYSLIKATPFGNTILKEMAIAAIEGEQLGKDDITDFLTVSFSSTDYVGHQFGPMSVEIEDTYLRLDKELAELLSFLEKGLKKEEVLIFLTADHGAVNVPQYLVDNHLPGGYFDVAMFKDSLKSFCQTNFDSDTVIQNISNHQIFFNYEELKRKKIEPQHVENLLSAYILTFEGMAKTYTRTAFANGEMSDEFASIIQRGFNHTRSGDILFVLESGWINKGYTTGTTHGSPYNYDTHVPLLWYGYGVKTGNTNQKTVIPDIAATIASILNIQMPSSCTGKPITEVLKK